MAARLKFDDVGLERRLLGGAEAEDALRQAGAQALAKRFDSLDDF